MTQQIYLDCDGVLADFDKRAEGILGMPTREYEQVHGEDTFWDRLYAVDHFFTEMDPLQDAHELVDAVKHLNPIILTGHPRGYWALEQKMTWRDKHFTGIPMITCRSVDKRKFCRPGDILVDDWHKYSHLWQKAGGIFVYHTSAKESISKLTDLGVI